MHHDFEAVLLRHQQHLGAEGVARTGKAVEKNIEIVVENLVAPAELVQDADERPVRPQGPRNRIPDGGRKAGRIHGAIWTGQKTRKSTAFPFMHLTDALFAQPVSKK